MLSPVALLRPPAIPLVHGKELSPIDRMILLESARGEHLVAALRVVVFSIMTLLATLGVWTGLGPPALRERHALMPLFLTPILVLGWGYLAWLRRHPYKPVFSLISVAADVTLMCAGTLLLMQLSGPEGAI